MLICLCFHFYLERSLCYIFMKVRSVIKFSHSSPLCINRGFFVDTLRRFSPFSCAIFSASELKWILIKKSGFLAKDYLSMKRNPLDVQNPHVTVLRFGVKVAVLQIFKCFKNWQKCFQYIVFTSIECILQK